MSEPDCCDLSDLVKTANPLPWTTDGPNDHSKPQQTASISPTVSVADQTYQYKIKVIDMKQLEVIKQRLPRGIDVRICSKNVLSFRVRFRKKGYPDQIKTFPEEKLAKQWLAEQERNALLGIHFPHIRSSEHLFGLIDQRGVTTRALDDGGLQDYQLASLHETWAIRKLNVDVDFVSHFFEYLLSIFHRYLVFYSLIVHARC